MARVADDGAVLHGGEGVAVDDVEVTGDRDPDVAFLGGFHGGHDAVALHDGLERLHRIDLEHDDAGAHAVRAARDAATAPAVAGDDDRAAGDQAVGGADDAVQRRLAGAVAVVEEVLGLGLVDGHDRVLQRTVGRHGRKADDAGGGLFSAADDVLEHLGLLGVDAAHDVGAVVHGHLRLVRDGLVDVLVVRLGVLALDRVGANAILRNECRGHVILRGERVARAQHDVGAAGLQGAHQVRGLGGDVQARAHAESLEGLLGSEPLADGGEYRHVGIGPLDARLASGSEAQDP